MDVQLYYEEKGAEMPLVLLHGNGSSGAYFAHQLDAFAVGYRVILVDTRGHGRSPRGTAPFTIRQFADDLADFLEAQSIKKAHILGFSDGANIAMCFAAKYPERVEKLILDGGNLYPRGVSFGIRLRIAIEYISARLFSKDTVEMLELMTKQPDISLEELSRITAKTLVMAGTKDLIKRSHTEMIAKNIRQSRLCLIPGDHFIAAQNPDAFNQAVLAFLEEA